MGKRTDVMYRSLIRQVGLDLGKSGLAFVPENLKIRHVLCPARKTETPS